MTEGTRSHYEVIVIGAGVAGIYQIKRLADLGIDALVLDAAPDLGGTWYWNRYPGARFDSESYTYGYSFSRELLDEWHWKERFSAQPENLRYLNYVADKFDLRKYMQFNCKVEAATFDEARHLWRLRLGDGRELTCRFVVLAIGLLSTPTPPRLEGMERFKGRSFHTFYWPHEPVELAGKKVAIIGTGATAIQMIGEIADKVGELTVFQRRPNWSAPLNNSPISDAEMADIRARYDEIFAACARTPGRLRARTGPARLLRGHPRGAAGAVGQALRRARLWHLAEQFPRDLHRRGGQRRVFRLHRRSHPPPRQGSRHRGKADPEGPWFRRAAGAAGDQLFRGLQPRQRPSRRYQRDADRAGDGNRPANQRARLRFRHHHLLDRLRRHHWFVRPHRHHRRRTASSCSTNGATARRPSSA